MKYQFGMYGGDFSPLTIGHVKCILSAASMCEELSVIICYDSEKDEIPPVIKYRWIHNIVKHIGNVRIYMVKNTYDNGVYNWEKGRDDIVGAAGHDFDVVFSGVDHKEEAVFERLYPKAEIVYFDFDRQNVSSTLIRSDPYKYWDIIPDVVKPHYVKKVCLMGGESAGKSTLVKNLAITYNTNYIEEEGRDVCEEAGTEDTMIMEDFAKIMLKHKWNELEAIKHSNKLLFIDTEVLTTKWFFNFLRGDDEQLGTYNEIADSICKINDFDEVIFLEPDGIPFIQDGTRNEKIEADRKKYSEEIKDLLRNAGINFHTVSGSYHDRYMEACEICDGLLGK